MGDWIKKMKYINTYDHINESQSQNNKYCVISLICGEKKARDLSWNRRVACWLPEAWSKDVKF